MQQGQITAGQEWRAHWPLVMSALVAYSFVAVPSITLGLYMEPMQREFGWSRSQFSMGLTVLAVVSLPLAPFAGALADRFGSRRVAIPGVTLHALVFAAFGLVSPSIWHWLGTWAVYALAQLLIRSMIWTGAISAVFTASRGLAISIFMSGTAVATVLGPIITRWLIDDYGWRMGFIGTGLGWGGLGLLLVLIFFHDRRHRGSDKAGQVAAPVVAPVGGLSLREAVRSPQVIRIGIAMFLQSVIASGFIVHLVPMLGGAGISRGFATSVISLTGFTALAGQLTVGYLIDKVKTGFLPVFCFAWPGLWYFILLQMLGGSQYLVAGAVLAASLGTAATPALTIYLVTRHAGLRNFGSIFGVISSFMALGGGFGPLLAASIFDATGAYTLYLLAAATGAVLSGVALFRLGPYPVFAAADPEQQQEELPA